MMTRSEAEAIYDAGRETVVRVLLMMDARIDALEERVRSLENQLAKNSRNSGRPPSSDGFGKPAPKSLRKQSGRKSGGQPGHSGHALPMVANPDHTETHRAGQCQRCGRSLAGQPAGSLEKRQVHDLPPLRMFVTEHHGEIKVCRCGHRNKAPFPEGVNAPVQYGDRIKAACVYLRNYQHLPYARTGQLLEDFFGCSISEGTLETIMARSHELAAAPVGKIKAHIESAAVAHFDETGSRVEGKLWWTHSASTRRATYYGIHRKRGGQAFDCIGILTGFSGRAIHDFWKPYFGYGCLHGLCNAHHLRELTFLHEEHKQDWAARMIDCLLEIKNTVDRAKETAGQLDQAQMRSFETRFQQILDEGYAHNPLAPETKKKRGRRKKSKARNLLERLDKHRSEALAFMYDFNVPFDNNQAERDLRMMKLQQKISGSFRTEHGAKTFCRIRSYISTARKNAVGAMDALTRLFRGDPFVPKWDTS